MNEHTPEIGAHELFTRLSEKEPTHIILPTLAALLSVNEAIVLQHLHSMLFDEFNSIDGHRWVDKTYAEWREIFPFWSEKTLSRIFLKLEKRGFVISSQPKRHHFNSSKSYRINYDNLGEFLAQHNIKMNEPAY